MSTGENLKITTKNLEATWRLGESLGANLKGGEVIELSGDIGTGKTALVRGIARGANISDEVASPTFTLSRIYKSPRLLINHFDFYRLEKPGIMKSELAESIESRETVIIEWANVVEGVLPDDRLRIVISSGKNENSRHFVFHYGDKHKHLLKGLKYEDFNDKNR